MHLFFQHSKINILSATGALRIWVGEWQQNVTMFYIYGAVPPRIHPCCLRACPCWTSWSHFVSWPSHPHPQELLLLYPSCPLLCSSDSRVCSFYQPLESILSKLCYRLFFLYSFLEIYNPMNLFTHFFLPHTWVLNPGGGKHGAGRAAAIRLWSLHLCRALLDRFL